MVLVLAMSLVHAGCLLIVPATITLADDRDNGMHKSTVLL